MLTLISVNEITPGRWYEKVNAPNLSLKIDDQDVRFVPVRREVYTETVYWAGTLPPNDTPGTYMLVFTHKRCKWLEVIFSLSFTDRWMTAPTKLNESKASQKLAAVLAEVLAKY